MQYGNCSIVLENLWEQQKRRRNRVQWWRWLGNQIHSSASKETGSLCSTYWSVWNIAGLVLIRVNSSSKMTRKLHSLDLLSQNSAFFLLHTFFFCCVSWIWGRQTGPWFWFNHRTGLLWLTVMFDPFSFNKMLIGEARTATSIVLFNSLISGPIFLPP